MRTPLRLATRRSALATTQAQWVADLLRARGHEVELGLVVTEGDVNDAPLTQIGGTGVFASAIRRALQEERVDLAVHSLKDLPSAEEPGLVVAAVPEREDPRDVLVARDGLALSALPAGAVVGTGSPRRAAQLLALRPDLQVKAIRGNIDTRIGQVASGACDAVVLARAGLARLGRLEVVTDVLEVDDMIPAPGQGALAVECRSDRSDIIQAVEALDDPDSRACVQAERSLLATFEAGCTAPIGAHAQIVPTPSGTSLCLTAFVGTVDGRENIRRSLDGSPLYPVEIGADLACRLLDEGADRFTTAPQEHHP
ncbi:hydroxymethylbilane synthase [Austwickia chelonae]|uniref:Porphobilinogen deaminase n=1 Tax=Austwickia chelonae NBRC 105200 TaxID=1184607 RepID=K6UL35_9MICO|nr:hydroxymethylbilane synthase [Austwickia chelonae]GAB76901.1 porphobilinogen deaminase [Austwickia chelonae NBRC 105200]SEW32141.1 hydroxymethylbilane synthase [Austwickia chelonae]